MKIGYKLAVLLAALSGVILLAAGFFASWVLERQLRDRLLHELRSQTEQVASLLQTATVSPGVDDRFLRSFARTAGIRLTLIDRNGVVEFDSDVRPDGIPMMENHLHRSEVEQALRTGIGVSTRHSATLDADMLYLARAVTPGGSQTGAYTSTAIVRAGMAMSHIQALMSDMRWKLAGGGILVFLIVSVIAIVAATRLTRPMREMAAIAQEIRHGALDRRIPVRSRDEMGQLAVTLNAMVDRLNDDIRALKKLEEVRSQFLGNVSHELRTPLFTLQGLLETLFHGAIDDPSVNRDFIERALANTRRLDALLADLIDISRIESGEMQMSFRYFPVNEFLQEIIDEMTPAAEQKGLKLCLTPGGPNLDVYGDRRWLKQALANIIDNGIKYTPAGRITVTTTQASPPADNGDPRLVVAVSDTGIGIPAEHHARIFERFYRVDRERSREAGGTGLGLAIVKHIIEAHQSTIQVESALGKGTTFSFSLTAKRFGT